MDKKIVLIDGHSILTRAFYGIPDLTNKEGLHTNAVYGFLNILFKVLEEEMPTHLIVAFDVSAPTFRHKMYEEYKGTRKPMADELRQQVPVIKDVLKTMNIIVSEKEGLEADDILGTLAKSAEREGFVVVVLSGDRDLLQLASDTIKIRIPKTKAGKTTTEDYYTKDVIEKIGIRPEQVIDLKGLMGDSSDNIPGVPGIGEKTALKILAQFPTVEEAIDRIEEMPNNRSKELLKNHTELAKLSKELATIKTDCKLDITLDHALIMDLFNHKAYDIIKKLEFKSILRRFESGMGMDMTWEEHFHKVSSKAEADKVFSECRKEKQIGVKVVLCSEKDRKMREDG
ncbi:MAG: DNA polymerase I, partial [Lachnoclostridium sp.]|nr:DNA polymerase I [Lachnoclostridium sp.]